MSNNNILQKYLNEVNKIPDLSKEEESELFIKVKKGDKDAKEKIINAYLKLVVNIAKNLHKNMPNISILDLISEGNIGLIKAVDKYDINRGIKFSTYASWWIKQRIKRAINSNSIIKIPSHIDDLLRCFFKILNHNKTLSLNDKIDAANKVGVDLEKIEDFIEKGKNLYSLNYSDSDNACLEELIKNSNVIDPIKLYERRELFENLFKWLNVLTEKERKIIIMRFGLIDEAPMTLEEIGKTMNLTRERIRQIEENALSKLRFYLLKVKPEFFGRGI